MEHQIRIDPDNRADLAEADEERHARREDATSAALVGARLRSLRSAGARQVSAGRAAGPAAI